MSNKNCTTQPGVYDDSLFKIMFQTESNLYPSSTQKVQCTHDSGFYSVYVSISSYVGVATNQIQYMHLLIECTQTIQVV